MGYGEVAMAMAMVVGKGKPKRVWSKVLKLAPDRTIRLGKPRTGHFYGLLIMKNRFMQEK